MSIQFGIYLFIPPWQSIWMQAFTGYRSRSLHTAGLGLCFMSQPEACYYFAINSILYRTVSWRQKDLSFWHLSASVAQTIKDDSFREKLPIPPAFFPKSSTMYLPPDSVYSGWCHGSSLHTHTHIHPAFFSFCLLHPASEHHFVFCVLWHSYPCTQSTQANYRQAWRG